MMRTLRAVLVFLALVSPAAAQLTSGGFGSGSGGTGGGSPPVSNGILEIMPSLAAMSQPALVVQTITAVSFSGGAYQTGVASGATVGTATATVTPATLNPALPAAQLTWTLSGSNASQFSINSTTGVVTANGSTPTCSSATAITNVSAVATDPYAYGSPYTQALSITCEPAIPTMIQHYAGAEQPEGTQTLNENNIKWQMPNALQTGDTMICGFTFPSHSAALSPTTTSSRVALPASAAIVQVVNTGSTTAYVLLGNSSVVATTGNTAVAPGTGVTFTVGANVDIAGITASGSTTLDIVTLPSSITSGLGLTYVVAGPVADYGSGNYVAAIYWANVGSGGIETITLNLYANAGALPVQFDCSEFNNIAASPLNGGIQKAGITPPGSTFLLDPGNFTPTSNVNSTGGNLIWNYTAQATISLDGGGPYVTSYTAAAGYSPLEDDTGWMNTGDAFFHASQWLYQPAYGATDPTWVTFNSPDAWNSVTAAFQVAAAGSPVPSGIHVNTVQTANVTSPGSSTYLTLQLPTTGNLRAITGDIGGIVNSVTDSDGNSWTSVPISDGGTTHMWWYAPNTKPNPRLFVTIHMTAAVSAALFFYDIQGAAASPYDTEGDNGTPATCDVDSPDITPSAANELILVHADWGTGPATGITSPTGATFLDLNYPGQSDDSVNNHSNGDGIWYNGSSTSTANFTWTHGTGAGCGNPSQAVAFHG